MTPGRGLVASRAPGGKLSVCCVEQQASGTTRITPGRSGTRTRALALLTEGRDSEMRKSLGVLLAIAALLPISVLAAGPASAAAGTTCSGTAGTVTWSPPLPLRESRDEGEHLGGRYVLEVHRCRQVCEDEADDPEGQDGEQLPVDAGLQQGRRGHRDVDGHVEQGTDVGHPREHLQGEGSAVRRRWSPARSSRASSRA